MLASHGDTLETRVIVRFDTLPQTYTKSTIDSTIVSIDTRDARRADREAGLAASCPRGR